MYMERCFARFCSSFSAAVSANDCTARATMAATKSFCDSGARHRTEVGRSCELHAFDREIRPREDEGGPDADPVHADHGG